MAASGEIEEEPTGEGYEAARGCGVQPPDGCAQEEPTGKGDEAARGRV
jgi:hypothetical protein